MLQFDLPIMYRAEQYWNSGRMPIIESTKPKVVTVMQRLQFCILGVNKIFEIPNDAFMLQFVISSEKVPNSYEINIDGEGYLYPPEPIDDWAYDHVVKELGKAIVNHAGKRSVWYLQCFYWVVE